MVLNPPTGTLLSRVRYSRAHRRKLGIGRGSIRIGRFPHKFGPRHVAYLDMLSRQLPPGPQTCCHLPHGLDASRNGSRRKMAEADGGRRKLAEAENGRNSARVGRFPPPENLAHGLLGSQICDPEIIITARRHVAISTRTRSDPKQMPTKDGGSRRQKTEADGSRKWQKLH